LLATPWVFTYHHSQQEGWRSIMNALMRAGYVNVSMALRTACA